MNQMHPITLEYLAKAHRADLVADASQRRLAREVAEIGRPSSTSGGTPVLQHLRAGRARIVAASLAVVLALGAVGLAAGKAEAGRDPWPGTAPAASSQGGGGGASGVIRIR